MASVSIIDWVFSKLRVSRLKGMHNCKDGNMGGKDQKNKGHNDQQDKETRGSVNINVNINAAGTEKPSSMGPHVHGLEEEPAPAPPDDPSYPGDAVGESSGGSSSGSSSCVSQVSSPSPSPVPGGGGGLKGKKNRHRHYHKHNGQQNSRLKRLRHVSTTESSENGSDSSSTLEREAPDGGWGWVVVAAAFLVNLIADGVTLSFGVFFKDFADVFGSSKGTTAWVGSLLAAMPLLSGPIASTLTDRYGCRKVTVFGGILASFGCLLSYYVSSIYVLMLTFGVITGFGLSLCYVAAVVIVAYYFERKRSLATGLSACGSGIGAFIFNPLMSHSLETLKWQYTMLIIAGFFLCLSFCGLFMKDLEWTKKSHKKKEKLLQNRLDFNTQAQHNLLIHGDYCSQEGNGMMGLKNERLCNSALCIPTFVQEQERQQRSQSNKRLRYYSNTYGNFNIPEISDDLKISNSHSETFSNGHVTGDNFPSTNVCETSTGNNQAQTQTLMTNNDTLKDNNNTRNLTGLSTGVVFNDSDFVRSTNNISETCDIYHTPCFNQNSELMKCSSNNSSSNNNAVNINNEKNSHSITNNSNAAIINHTTVNSNNNLIDAENSFGEPSALALTMQNQKTQDMRNYVVHHTKNFSGNHRHSLTYRGAVLSLKRYRLRPASSCPDIVSVATTDDRNTPEWKAVLLDIYVWMSGIFAWDNLSNTRFLLFIISNFLLYTWYDIPYYFLSDSATDIGYTAKEGAWLGSTIGICNVVGNIILGYIGDRKWANSVTVYGVCISICGIMTALMPCYFNTSSSGNYYELCVLCGVFGVMIAANYSLTSVILVQVVSLERFANAYGLLLLVQGVGNLLGPPIAGKLTDYTGTWHWSFWVAGGGIILSNIFILAPIYKRHEDADKLSNPSVSIVKEDSQA